METKYFTRDTHIGAVHLNVNFIDNSVKFYHEVLGMDILGKEGEAVVVGIDNRPLIYLYQTNTRRNETTVGLFHFALLVPTRQDLGNMFQHLINTRYPMEGASDHDVSEALYLSDPEGNGIEIYHDRHTSEWQYNNNEIIMATAPMDFQGVLDENDGKSFKGLPKDTVMGHIHLQVKDIKMSYEFYCDVIGMDLMTRYGNDALFMSAGGYHHHLGLNVWNHKFACPLLDEPGLRKYDINFPIQDDFDYFRAKISELGLPIEKDGNSDIIRDPNGIGIRIMHA